MVTFYHFVQLFAANYSDADILFPGQVFNLVIFSAFLDVEGHDLALILQQTSDNVLPV